MQEKTKHEAAHRGSCDMRSYRLAAKKVRGEDGGRRWNEPKAKFADECKLASMSDDVTKSRLSDSTTQRSCVFAVPRTKYSWKE